MKRSRPDSGPEARDSTVRPQKDQLPLPAEHRVDTHSPAKISQVSTTRHADVLAIVDEFAGRRVIERARATAQPGPALEESDSQTAIDQSRRRRKTSQAATDDHDMRRKGFSDVGHGFVAIVLVR